VVPVADDLFYLPPADRLQYELAEVDEHFHLLYGADEAAWFPLQVRAYQRAINHVWAQWTPPAVEVAA